MKKLLWRDISQPGESLHVAYVAKSTAKSWELHCHDFYEIFIVESGKGVQCGPDGSRAGLRGGDVVFVRPDDTHGFEAQASTEPFTLINVAFPRKDWAALRDQYGLHSGGFFDESAPRPPCLELMGSVRLAVSRLFNDLIHRERTRLVRDGFLLGLAGHLLTPREAHEIDQAPPWLKKTLLGAETDLEVLRAGTAGLAARSGYSAPHLTRVMRQTLGVSPGEWILACRLRRAEQLLLATGLSISEVAAESGFDNLSHFHRCFRLAKDMTPAAFRRRHARRVV